MPLLCLERGRESVGMDLLVHPVWPAAFPRRGLYSTFHSLALGPGRRALDDDVRLTHQFSSRPPYKQDACMRTCTCQRAEPSPRLNRRIRQEEGGT